MKLKLLLIILLPASCLAQMSDLRFFIHFTDKNNSPYSISNPSAYLSAKALQRRTNQNIAIDSTDLPVNPQYIDSVTSLGATIINPTKWLNGVVISVPDSATLLAVQALPFVQNTVHVKRVRKDREKDKVSKFELENSYSPLRVHSAERTTSFYNYGLSYAQVHMMNLDYLHDLGFHGEGMTITLLDAGFNSADNVPALSAAFANGHLQGTWDFVMNEASVYEDDNHGEEVLSCIVSNVDGQLIGTAPEVNFWLVRTEDAPTENFIEEYNWATGAEFADSVGTDIISSSLGYSTFDSTSGENDHTYADMNGHTAPSSIAGNIAFSKGILVLVSAGNSGSDPWHYISAPSDGDNVLSIAAVDSTGNHAGFSSYGPSSDGDIKPNIASQGSRTALCYPDGTIGRGSGTSFACPVMAGAAACLWQSYQSSSNIDIFNALQESASQYNNPDDELGYGIPNFMRAYDILHVNDPNIAHEDHLSVTPNPFSGNPEVIFSSASSGNITTELIDVLGKVILTKGSRAEANSLNRIYLPDLSSLTKGIYFLRVTTEEKSFLQKVVKL